MKLIGNIIWLLCGGLEAALGYFMAGTIMCITIIGIPFGLQAIKLGEFMLWPFGSKVELLPGQPGCLSTIMNILWLVVSIPICLVHLLFGAILCVTIIGIPFGVQHFKFAGIALTPFGRTVKSDI
ncbi:MAG: YccF domain-containing protein [Bacteroidaceae bacterium]|nr:YccF domain-containing protein [Bacteroidaceae bacterium]MBQ8008207.1 YccF domain-containing protein [Bacteroidaceae bacterium]MBR1542269.1 YccF domain-containing protein [Bacteroidaceae bacterium]